MCIRDRRPLFTCQEIVEPFQMTLVDVLARQSCGALVYLFMPDHLHLLMQGLTSQADLLAAASEFKQRTGYWLSRHEPDFRWQKDFYDHVLRREDEVEKHVRYILNNPFRAGLVDDWRTFPFRGSTLYDLNTW